MTFSEDCKKVTKLFAEADLKKIKGKEVL